MKDVISVPLLAWNEIAKISSLLDLHIYCTFLSMKKKSVTVFDVKTTYFIHAPKKMNDSFDIYEVIAF